MQTIISFFCFTLLSLIACNDSSTEIGVEKETTTTDTIHVDRLPAQEEVIDINKNQPRIYPLDSLLKTKILTTGKFHKDEVWQDADKGNWFGLFSGKAGFYLAKTEVTTKRVHDVVLDGNKNEKTGWEVSTNITDRNIILIEALPYLANRKIERVNLPRKFIFPGDTVSFSYLNNEYKIFAAGEKRKIHNQSDDYIVSNYKLYLTATIKGHQKTQLLVAQPHFDDKMIEILFAGDIDGDDILDLIINTSRHYNMSIPTVYFSKPAEKNHIVKPMGSHVSVGG